MPAIVGQEPAFIHAGRNNEEFIIARNSTDILKALELLRNDPEAYQKLVDNGSKRAQEYSISSICSDWQQTIETSIIPAAIEWGNKPLITKLAIVYIRFARYFIKPKNILDPLLSILKIK